ncbi:MAG TPA: uracil-DNA glycosylase family protein [Gammaproteobacteria bacterium]|nr:uracil-DNA glycosylase family protein [Gammaproteobacteria bacterium]
MQISEEQRAAFRTCARKFTGIDHPVYSKFDRDPLEPIIGLGDTDSRICFFGRDPGTDEVRHATPFIGAGGQKIRSALYRYLHRCDMPDFEASMEVGKLFFWANTVPYKPIGNKAWSMKVKRNCHHLMADVLLKNWRGSDIIVLGREAFFWFGIGRSRQERAALDEFWRRGDRYAAMIEVDLASKNDARKFRLHPLPHPSPLNATWYKRFPELLTQRLEQLDVRPSNLKLSAV